MRFRPVAGGLNLYEGLHRQSKFGGVGARHIAGDDALLLQPLLAPPGLRRGQVQPLCQLR